MVLKSNEELLISLIISWNLSLFSRPAFGTM